MELFLAVLGATGVVVATAANATNIARFVGERRRAATGAKHAKRPASATAAPSGAGPAPPDAATEALADDLAELLRERFARQGRDLHAAAPPSRSRRACARRSPPTSPTSRWPPSASPSWWLRRWRSGSGSARPSASRP